MAQITDNEYTVNWTSHTDHMKEAFESLFDHSEFVDVTLYCEGRKIGAHKTLLSACSPYFRGIFKDVPCQHHVIVLNNVDFSIMEHIVRFIYHGEVSVPTSKLNLFVQTAQMLKISGLIDGKALKDAAECNVVEVTGGGGSLEPVTKRKRDHDDDDDDGCAANVGQIVKLPRPDNVTCPDEFEEMGLMNVKSEPEDLVFDPYGDPLQHDSSFNHLLQETQFLTENEKLESETTMDEAIIEEVADETMEATNLMSPLLPHKSKRVLYEEAYSEYRKWRSKNNIETTTEADLLSYFSDDLAHYVSSSLWSKYSMLRSTINLRENVDISTYSNVVSFLRQNGEGGRRPAEKSPLTLTKKHVNEFLTLTDTRQHLLNKLAHKKANEVEFITDFIETYKNHPALWKIKATEYSNRYLKDKGYAALLEVYQHHAGEPVNVDMVKKKINCLRGAFRRELKKVRAKNSGTGTEEGEDYRPTLWYYNLLLFTADNEEPRSSAIDNENNGNGDG